MQFSRILIDIELISKENESWDMPEIGKNNSVPEHVIQEFLTMLSQGAPDVVTALETLKENGNLQRRHETVLSFMRFQLQSLVHDIDAVTLGIVTETHQPEVQPNIEIRPEAVKVLVQKAEKQKHSFGYDYLILDAFRHRARLELPTNLSYLTKLATAYDPNVKRRSLSAKLNRWKHELGYVTYDRSTDIHITDVGERHRDALLPHVRDENSLERIQHAFELTQG